MVSLRTMTTRRGGEPATETENGRETPSSAQRPMLNKDVKLEELAAYFHLPEKAVAKELGICLTSLKKMCRSYGITRWPFRKLKSLERTMKKVQNEHDAAPNVLGTVEGGDKAGNNEVKRKPYIVCNKTVFLSDEELEVFKMTMGKDQAADIKAIPQTTLETPLFDHIQGASAALASVVRGGMGTLSALMESGVSVSVAQEAPRVSVEVDKNTVTITNWSCLWSQPQLKGRLLDPLQGVAMRVSIDGVTAELDFKTESIAERAMRIVNMAKSQAIQHATSGPVPAIPMPNTGSDSSDPFRMPLPMHTHASGSGGMLDMNEGPLSGGCEPLMHDHPLHHLGMQPPSMGTQPSWTAFLQPATAILGQSSHNLAKAHGRHGEGGGSKLGASAEGVPSNASASGFIGGTAPKSSDSLGRNTAMDHHLPSPPISDSNILDDHVTAHVTHQSNHTPLSVTTPLSNLFPSLFREPSTNNLSAYLKPDRQPPSNKDKELERKEPRDKGKVANTPGKKDHHHHHHHPHQPPQLQSVEPMAQSGDQPKTTSGYGTRSRGSSHTPTSRHSRHMSKSTS